MTNSSNKKSVVSGHQCMFLGGPLFVLLKIIGVIHTAQKKSLRPIFWMETNDADFEEISQTGLINRQKNYQKIKLSRSQIPLPNGFRIGDTPINDHVLQKVHTFFDQLPQTQHTPSLKNITIQAYAAAKNLGEANILLFQEIIKKSSPSFQKLAKNLTFFDPRQQKFLDFCRPFFLKESLSLQNNQQCPFFALNNQSREALFKKDDHFWTRANQKIDWDKTTFLPSLATRSIVQDAFLHTAIYLAGPHEQKYLQEMQNNYKKHLVKPSKIVQRMSVVFFSQKNLKDIATIKNFLQKKSGTTIDEKNLLLAFWQMEQQALLAHCSLIGTKFDGKKEEAFLKKTKTDFVNQLNQNHIEPCLIKKVEKQIHQHQKYILGEKRKTNKQTMSEILPTIRDVSLHIRPQKSQERDLNFLYFLNHFGLEFVEQLEKIYAAEQKILCETENEAKEKLLKEYIFD